MAGDFLEDAGSLDWNDLHVTRTSWWPMGTAPSSSSEGRPRETARCQASWQPFGPWPVYRLAGKKDRNTIQPVERSPMAVAFGQQQRAHPRPEISRPFWLSPVGIEGWPFTTVIQQSVH